MNFGKRHLTNAAHSPKKSKLSAAGLRKGADMLYSYLTFCDELDVKITRVAEYIMRKSDEDTGNSYYNGLKGRFMSVYINIAGASSFDTPRNSCNSR